MNITLTLNNRQVAMLHAIFGRATTQDIATAICENYHDYLATESNSAVCAAYKRTVTYMNNHNSYAPFGGDDLDLFDALNDAMALTGRNFQNNEEKEN